MAEIIKNTLLGGAAGVGANYLTDGGVMNVINTVKDTVTGAIGSNQPLLTKATPMIGAAAPFALAGYAGYKGVQEVKKSNLWNGIERTLLTYGVPGYALGALGLLSAPLSGQVLAAGAGMYSVKKLTSAISNSVSVLKKAPDALFSLPGKALDKTWSGIKGLKSMKWIGGRGTPAIA